MSSTTDWIDGKGSVFTKMADDIWRFAEPAWSEKKSAGLQADYLREIGFSVTRDLSGIPTAFVAEWGAGDPVIGFVGEYDALPGLSQKAVPYREPVSEGGPGHGCGHNLLGTGCLASAAAIRYWLEESGTKGTVRYYGCPAEEQISAKTFMAKSGYFDDLSAALNFHPSNKNMPGKGTAVGVYDATFTFRGTAAHAGGSPEKGRSALDAVELMNVGVNYLREHVPDKVRIHYAITDGGAVPNIVPDVAKVWYFVRALERKLLDEVYERIQKVAQGAALMTETRVEVAFNGACSSLLNNHYLADLHFEAMKEVGPIEFTADEIDFAKAINEHYPKENTERIFADLRIPDEHRDRIDDLRGCALIDDDFPAFDEEEVSTGSTDVGDVSWITPLSMLQTTCFSSGAAGHSWGITASSGSSIGHKGMLHAAKIMALTAEWLYSDETHLERARSEFEARIGKTPYVNPIPDGVTPPASG